MEISDNFKNMAIYVEHVQYTGKIILFRDEIDLIANQSHNYPVLIPTANVNSHVNHLGFVRKVMGSMDGGSSGSYLLYAANADTISRCDLGERVSNTAKTTFLTVAKIEHGVLCCAVKPESYLQKADTGLTRRQVGIFGAGPAFVVVAKNGVYIYQEGTAKGSAPTVSKIPDLDYATKACWYQNFLVLVVKKKDEEFVRILELSDRYLAYEFSMKNSIETLFPSKTKPKIMDLHAVHSQTTSDTSHSGGHVQLVIQLPTAAVLLSLNEKSAETKLELLRKKYKYRFAINMAKTIPKIDYDTFSKDIRKQYGDYLFSKGEYQDAIRQYILTIGSVEPSYVIRKFLDSQRNTYLIQYLYVLHKKRNATHEHTTLLLNCFMRLDDYSDDDGSIKASQAIIDDKKKPLEQTEPAEIDDDEEGTDESLKELMRDVERKDKKKILDEFKLKHEELNYDQVTAISVMRKNGYREQALALAENFAELNPNEATLHDWVIKIYIEDFPKQAIEDKSNFQKALYHIESLERAVATTFMLKYGKILVTELPQRATNLLIRLCCNYTEIPPKVPKDDLPKDYNRRLDDRRTFILPEKRQLVNLKNWKDSKVKNEEYDFTIAANYIFAFADQPFWLMVFLEVVTDYMLHVNKKKNIMNMYLELGQEKQSRLKAMYNTLLELYLRALNMDPQVPKESKKEVQIQPYVAAILPSTAPTLPVVALLSPPPNVKPEEEDMYNIYPVYENQLSDPFPVKAQNLITEAVYDDKHALVLCQGKSFEVGILHLYAKLGLKYDIIQYFMDKEADVTNEQQMTEKFSNILDRCQDFGKDDPNMWIQVLTYFVSGDGSQCTIKPAINARLEPEKQEMTLSDVFVNKVLTAIKEQDVLPPLLVVQILSQNRNIELKTIKDYLSEKLSKEQKKIREQNITINELQKDTQKLKADITELRTCAKIFQLTQCSYCNKQLDLPAVHFMCMHSYHQRCLENEECARCANKNKEYLQNMRTKQKNKLHGQNGEDMTLTVEEKHDSFFKMLENAKQGFETVAKQFGTNLFPPTTAVDVEAKGK